MGKNRDRESLIRLIVNTVVHEVLIKNSNRPESTSFLASEIIEYERKAGKFSELHNWNDEDKKYVQEKSLEKIKEKLKFKYSDIICSPKDPELFLVKELKSFGL